MKALRSLLASLLFFSLLSTATSVQAEDVKDIRVTFKTSKGDIDVTIFASKVPVTAASFLNLAKHDYYDGLTFHRVINDFMIQGGCPLGTGTGDPGYKFEDEFVPGLVHDKAGILSMANSGPRTNGSQFFITHGPTPHLNGKHTVFGEVTKGQDIVDAITKGDKIVDIEVLDSTDALFTKQAARIAEWDKKIKAGR